MVLPLHKEIHVESFSFSSMTFSSGNFLQWFWAHLINKWMNSRSKSEQSRRWCGGWMKMLKCQWNVWLNSSWKYKSYKSNCVDISFSPFYTPTLSVSVQGWHLTPDNLIWPKLVKELSLPFYLSFIFYSLFYLSKLSLPWNRIIPSLWPLLGLPFLLFVHVNYLIVLYFMSIFGWHGIAVG